tara:strand:+ start:952 stop:1593 length:642 start_codon:yes stop_codon:yes gene_type:complete
MMPSEVERAYWARRLTTRGYVDWLAGTMDLPIDESMYGESKNVIDYRYQTMLSEKPAWVEAAEEVLAEAVQEEPSKEPDVPVEEDFEPHDPMEEPDVPVEEDIVDEDGDGEPDSPFEINTDYDAMTVVELRDICRERGLTVRGTKAEIVLRLRRDDDGIVEEETVETDNDETEAPAEAAAEESSDAPSEEEAATEEVTTDADSGETSNTDEEE